MAKASLLSKPFLVRLKGGGIKEQCATFNARSREREHFVQKSIIWHDTPAESAVKFALTKKNQLVQTVPQT